MVDLVAFGIMLDDIVYPDGRTAMGVLGGGGAQTAFGMRLWSEAVGLFAGVGRDLPRAVWDWLEQSEIDAAGVHVTELPTLRAWQILEGDGQRTQVWRVPGPVIGAQSARSLALLPEAYRVAKGFHYGIHPEEPNLAFAHELREANALVSLEPFKPADQPLSRDVLERIFSAGQIFSPNLNEAISMVGPGEPIDLARRMAEAGAEVVALRLGEQGSLVWDGTNGKSVQIPAVPVRFSDPIGAGNAYCGGFLVGWLQTGDAVTAGAYGAVAASFLGEQAGVPVCSTPVRREARRRLNDLLANLSHPRNGL